MDVTVRRSAIAGTARAPPSKSYTHRAILAAGYGEGAVVTDPLLSADTRATARAVEAFGGAVRDRDDGAALDVTGFHGRPSVPDDVIDCANSGTTIRLTTATASLADGLTVLSGDRSLRSRPHGPLLSAIRSLGGRAESTRGNGQAPLVIGGPIDGGRVTIPGDVSSQFVTAMLMAGAVTDDGITIELSSDLKSAPYVEITREVLADFGIETESAAAGFHAPGGQTYRATGGEYAVPGDFSSISYVVAAGAIAAREGEAVLVRGARPSAQGDVAIIDVLKRMGATVEWYRSTGELVVRRSQLAGVTVDVGDTPDLLPTIATLGAVADGTTRIENAEHVRYKETDRLSAMAEELSALGAVVDEEPDRLVVYGGESELVGSTVDGRGDHRVIMSLAVAGLAASGETTITGAEHVDVSFPDFFDVLDDLGANVRQ